MQAKYEKLHKAVLAIVREDAICRRLITMPGVGSVVGCGGLSADHGQKRELGGVTITRGSRGPLQNREFNREFCRIRPSTAIFVSDQRADSIVYSPYATEQGISKHVSGKIFPGTGNFHLRIVGIRPPPRRTEFSGVTTVHSRRRRNGDGNASIRAHGNAALGAGFGCGAVGGLMVRGDPLEQERTIARVIAAGMNYFDTAMQYGNSETEKKLGRVLLRLKPANVALGTKVRLSSGDFGGIASAVTNARR